MSSARSSVESLAPPAELAPAAEAVFGPRLERAQRYAALLAGPGAVRGLLGPREGSRLWDRHLLNSAVVSELLPPSARVVDVGSGAGLPGLALACRRGDLQLILVESMQRRVEFLQMCRQELELGDQVRVVHGRVEDRAVVDSVGRARWVTARAVAPLDRLVRWCLPLMSADGRLLAIKGALAVDEVRRDANELKRSGAIVESVVQCGVGIVSEPTTVVVVTKR